MAIVSYLRSDQPLGQYVCDRVEFDDNHYLVYFNVKDRKVYPSVMTHLRRGAGDGQVAPTGHEVKKQVQKAYDESLKKERNLMEFALQERPDYFLSPEESGGGTRPHGVLCKRRITKHFATLYHMSYLHRENGEAIAHAYIQDSTLSPAVTPKQEDELKTFMEIALSIEMTIDKERYVPFVVPNRLGFV